MFFIKYSWWRLQEISVEFFLDAEETFSRAEFALEGNIVATVDSDGATECKLNLAI